MSHYSPKPDPEQYKDRQDYLRDKREWDKQERQADLEMNEGVKELSNSPGFQKLSLFLGHVVFFAMLSVLIFDQERRADFLEMIADPNPLFSIAKAMGFILFLYIVCITISPFLGILAVISIGVLVLVLPFLL
ncbi:MAG: hypothetical protein IM473_11815 [Microcystis sp. M015S2]|jgi:hypothetical protein|uniref:Uncharacterized protein n=1 Tax=Microcystis aeruginosa Ma_SC_T_19800800_S464 TaxID=2486257 RepID=A0A552DSN4_MICAE|nr:MULTISPECIES: hypothetical protein [unclassified Microcystis]TRT85037.1 MAG: hypothetical protein EWV82_07625 [Microcystis aeruginosa Ma_AC_P_19900807_S299]TRU25193.1 MAG: hypothetical protein EWV81_12650 [Microcystis aeruginosa Ma_SC_T_19800800_S464]MCA2711163.1 hypothetical protein [Microcystis sp. M025S2]MCA2743071.1 hypothetical protein [Microcystis sp. M015S2]MCA2759858.1 hypothetical protein [Microcystis sp. M145S2]